MADSILRTTIVLDAHCQFSGHEPATISCRTSSAGTAKDEAYTRQRAVPNKPEPIEVGWADPTDLVVIKNLTGLSQQKNPTAEELAELKKAIVYVGPESLPKLIPIKPFGGCALIPIGEETLFWHVAGFAEAKILCVPRAEELERGKSLLSER